MKRVLDEYDKIRNTPNPNQGKTEEIKKKKENKEPKEEKK